MKVIYGYYCRPGGRIYWKLTQARRSMLYSFFALRFSLLRHDLSDHAVPLIQDKDASVRAFAVPKVRARRWFFSLLCRLRLYQFQQRLRLALFVEDDSTDRILAAVGRQFVGVDVEHLARRDVTEQEQVPERLQPV